MAAVKSSKEFIFTWKIQNFSMLNLRNGEFINSPEFVIEKFGGIICQLELYPKGYNDKFSEYISCHLRNLSFESIIVDFSIEFITLDGKIANAKYKNKILKRKEIAGWNTYLKQETYLNKSKYFEDILTLCCRITRKDCVFANGCIAKTKINTERILFHWNFVPPESPQWSQSKIVHFPNIPIPIEIGLTIPRDNIEIHLRKETSSINQFVKCKVALIDKKRNEVIGQEDMHLFDSENSVWTFPSFLKKSDLINKKDTLLTDGFFTLTFEMVVSNGHPLREVVGCTQDSFENESAARGSLQSMLDNTRNLQTDVKLKIGNDVFYAHKSVLAARSPVFRAMFAADMTEKESGVVDIPDLDADTLKTFLQFLYTGSLDNMGYESATKLLIASNKYKVLSLKEKCSAFLMSVITKENACEILAFSDMVKDKILKNFAIDYIVENLGSILPSPEWCQWTGKNYKLGMEVLCKIFAKFGNGKIKPSIMHD